MAVGRDRLSSIWHEQEVVVMAIPIGVLIRGKHVVCLSCVDDATYDREPHVALWPGDLRAYQECHDCRRPLNGLPVGYTDYDPDQCGECGNVESPAIALRAAAPDVEVGYD